MKPYEKRIRARQQQRRQKETTITPPAIEPYRPGLLKKIQIIRDVNRARKTVMKEPHKYFSRKFLVTLGIDILVLTMTRFGLSEDAAVELVKWVTGAYLVSQGAVDAAGPIGDAILRAKPVKPAVEFEETEVGYLPVAGGTDR